jgi:uncharacterized membrane protein YoaK (UPF0700 family)
MGVTLASEKGCAMLSRPGIGSLVGWILAFWAGATNTVTTLALYFERSSHVSGRLNDVGMNAVLFPIDAVLVFVIWIFFVFGAFLAGMVLDRIGFTRSLLLVAGGIGLGALLIWRGLYVVSPDDYTLGRMIIAGVLPAAMGFQNALSSMLPRIGRSTHWTGDSTDIGIALAKRNFPLAAHNTIKIFGFICGAATLGYVIGIRDVAPLYGLVLVATGYFLTAILLHCINLALSKS